MSPNLTKEEIRLFNDLHKSKEQDSITFSKPQYRMFWDSIVDKYKGKAHFVYELLQNADDVSATEVKFKLEKNKLIFSHNGTIGFSVSPDNEVKEKGHINAITGVGWSTKDEDVEKIGKFGVGFKAVFQYTKEPYIYDDKFWFKIENYIVPTALDTDYPGRKEGETVFVFPFFDPDTAFKEIKDRLKSLENPILFLKHLNKIDISLPNEEKITYAKELNYKKVFGNITHELLFLNNNQDSRRLHLFSKPVDLLFKGKHYMQDIAVGYFVDDKGDLSYRENFKVYCFFPTEEDFGLRCVVHAPFLLVDSRQSIKDDPINEKLERELAELAAESLPLLRDYGLSIKHLLINENVFHIIPKPNQNIYETSSEDFFYYAYIKVLKCEKLLLSREGNYLSCNEALICRPQSLLNYLNDEQLVKLYEYKEKDTTKHFLNETIQRIYDQDYVKDVLKTLDVEVFNGTLLAQMITPEFMNYVGLTWAKRLYSHLRNEEQRLYRKVSRSGQDFSIPAFWLSPIILSSDGKWLKPYLDSGEHNVYIPLGPDSKGYNFASQEYINDEDSMSFLKEMELKTPDEWDYIQTVILKSNVDEETQDGNVHNVEIIYQYITKLDPADRKDKIELISDEILICCNNNEFYAPKEALDDDEWLEKYFGNKGHFVNYKYYQKLVEKISIENFRKFLYDLGLAKGPIVERFTEYWPDTSRFPIGRYTSAHVDDYRLKGFTEWTDIDIDTSKHLWQWLSQNIDILKSHMKAVCHYFYYVSYEKEATSTLFNELLSKKWIYKNEGILTTLSNIHSEDLESQGYLMDYNLINFFGVEKNSKSLEELGASASQIQQYKIGQLAMSMGLDSEEKMIAVLSAYKEKYEQEKAKSNSQLKQGLKQGESQNEELTTVFDIQSKTNLEEMSSSQVKIDKSVEHREKNINEKIEEINQKASNEARKKIEEGDKRAIVANMPKYSKAWFDALLDLEYGGYNGETNVGSYSVRIVFNGFQKDLGSDNVYNLYNPSQSIPLWIENYNSVSVRFYFYDKDEISFTFEVSKVEDFSIRLRAYDESKRIDDIDLRTFSRAEIELTRPAEFLQKLVSSFHSLPFDNNFNFKENLGDNISFIFGPPGTGKTTRLVKVISEKIKNEKCKILVLAPTNKACDVLTRKLMEGDEYITWLGRFVATGDPKIEESEALIDRNSELYKSDKCCIISTIARLPYDGFNNNGEKKLLKDIEWDLVIVDEASMIPLVQIVYAIYKFTNVQFLIAGDPLQIEPIVKENDWKGENIFTMVNLLDFANSITEPIKFKVERLETQYRSIESIGNLFSNYCYGGLLTNARLDTDQRKLQMGNIPAKAVTFVPFRVERNDSIYGAKKLQGSNVHIYSALFAVEYVSYIAKQQKAHTSIVIICPYAPQAQLMNKLMEQRQDLPDNVEISVGTIHGFQGDQCDIIFTVFNPPTGINAVKNIMLNNKNVINVAISRAKEYLFILLPHPMSYGYKNLVELNKLAKVAKEKVNSVTVINADQIEKDILGDYHYIENHTFVSTHQTANVYSHTKYKYEIRIDENAIDVQIGNDLADIGKLLFEAKN